jgi:hypothetical protein
MPSFLKHMAAQLASLPYSEAYSDSTSRSVAFVRLVLTEILSASCSSIAIASIILLLLLISASVGHRSWC